MYRYTLTITVTDKDTNLKHRYLQVLNSPQSTVAYEQCSSIYMSLPVERLLSAALCRFYYFIPVSVSIYQVPNSHHQ